MGRNGQKIGKWAKIGKICRNWYKKRENWQKMAIIGKMGRNWPNISEMGKKRENGQKWAKNCKMGRNGKNWQNGQKWERWATSDTFLLQRQRLYFYMIFHFKH